MKFFVETEDREKNEFEMSEKEVANLIDLFRENYLFKRSSFLIDMQKKETSENKLKDEKKKEKRNKKSNKQNNRQSLENEGSEDEGSEETDENQIISKLFGFNERFSERYREIFNKFLSNKFIVEELLKKDEQSKEREETLFVRECEKIIKQGNIYLDDIHYLFNNQHKMGKKDHLFIACLREFLDNRDYKKETNANLPKNKEKVRIIKKLVKKDQLNEDALRSLKTYQEVFKEAYESIKKPSKIKKNETNKAKEKMKKYFQDFLIIRLINEYDIDHLKKVFSSSQSERLLKILAKIQNLFNKFPNVFDEDWIDQQLGYVSFPLEMVTDKSDEYSKYLRKFLEHFLKFKEGLKEFLLLHIV